MDVYQIRLKLYLFCDIRMKDVSSKLSAFIDQSLAKNEAFLELHQTNCFKNYVFDSFYPIEKDKVYKKDALYQITIRTIDKTLAFFFSEKLVNDYNADMKAVTSDIYIIPRKIIDKIYSITPVVIKDDHGYWKEHLSLTAYEKRLKENIIKKYNFAMNTKIIEDFPFYLSLEFMNQKPIAVHYKNITLLADKIGLHIESDQMSQELAYFSLGVGLCEMNARGFGFVNYQYL